MLYVVQGALRGERPRDVIRRSTIIAVIAFLTLIDLFGSQALLPMLVEAFAVEPALMGFAVNASTLGMAFASVVVAWFADRIDRKRGIWLSLALLSIPTMLLGFVDNVWVFMALRVLQGVCMATAFTLTMTYLAEQCDVMAAGGAMAAYITGNVAFQPPRPHRRGLGSRSDRPIRFLLHLRGLQPGRRRPRLHDHRSAR